METFPEDLFEMVKARIVSGDERRVVGSQEGGAGRVMVMATVE